MTAPGPEVFLATTDPNWFRFLSGRSQAGRLDEANFWSPQAQTPQKRLPPGSPFFLKLKGPDRAIAGYGFFAHFALLSLSEAWKCFSWKNGDADELSFRRRIGDYRQADLSDPRTAAAPIGCTILRDLVLWPRERWIPWGAEQGFAPNVVRGLTERDPVRVSRLLGEIQLDGLRCPEDLQEDFELVDADSRQVALSATAVREGQGAFRARLLETYNKRCAITAERTEPVLDAAHIQPYLGPRSNHARNGILLTKEFHTLFDLGYVTVTPSLEVRISTRLRADFSNGRRYYAYDNQALQSRPTVLPSEAALEWHNRHVFRS